MQETFSSETQVTSDPSGHFLHPKQVFSPDGKWVVYDTRNDDTKIGMTSRIAMVNLETGEIVTLYTTQNQTEFGPGVGAVTFNPVEEKVMFIHGLTNCNADRPYGFTRRSGVAVEIAHPEVPIFLDARDIKAPFTPGALRGGTHAHSWSADGKWITFTYNDEIMRSLSEQKPEEYRDLRVVGVMAPQAAVNVKDAGDGEQIDGQMFSAIVTAVWNKPEPGSDQIDRAHEDGWIGTNGYINAVGTRQTRAIAFQGDVRDANDSLITEIFVVDLPEILEAGRDNQGFAGTAYSLPGIPNGVSQRRITYTGDRKHPGVNGPRTAVVSSQDGAELYFTMSDDEGIIQLYSVSPKGGEISQRSRLSHSIETSFSLSPDGKKMVFGSQGRLCVLNLETGESKAITSEPESRFTDLKSPNWSPDGKTIVYNRKVRQGTDAYFQIFSVKYDESK